MIEATGGLNTIYGGQGNDTLTGIGGTNHIYGDGGDDVIKAAGGLNTIDGGEGDDTLIGAGGTNKISGGTGNDVLTGIALGNVLDGGDGDDRINAIGAYVKAHGGRGDDRIIASGGYVEAHGDDGDDQLYALGLASNMRGGDGNDILVSMGNFNLQRGGAGRDVLVGLGQMNVQLGEEGDDILVGIGGINIQHGGDGNDVMFGQGGFNVQVGGKGNDILIAGGTGNLQFSDGFSAVLPADLKIDKTSFGTLIDKLDDLVGAGGGGDDIALGGGSGNVQFTGDGNDLLLGAGTAVVQFAGAGDDLIFGGGLAAVQYGDEGDDVIVGGGQAAVQFGGSGDDLMIGVSKVLVKKVPIAVSFQHGGAGSDSMIGMSSSGSPDVKFSTRVDAKTGQMKVFVELPKSVSVNAQLAGADDDLMLGLGTFNVQLGEAGDDVAIARASFNYVLGGAGTDTILRIGELKELLKPSLDTSTPDPKLELSMGGSIFAGGAGNDLIMGLADFLKLLSDAELDKDPAVVKFNALRAEAGELLSDLVEPVQDAMDALAKVDPFGKLIPSLPDVALMPNFSLGGTGADVLGGQGRLIGGAGADTYVAWFGENTTIDDLGTSMPIGPAKWAKDAFSDRSDFKSAGGGKDVLELRRFGVLDFDASDLEFERHGGQLTIGAGKGKVVLHGMDTAAGRVETLRLVNGTSAVDFDLVGAFKAANRADFDIMDHVIGTVSGSTAANQAAGSMADIDALLGSFVADGRDAIDRIADAVEPIKQVASLHPPHVDLLV